jgi:hypothetical protein
VSKVKHLAEKAAGPLSFGPPIGQRGYPRVVNPRRKPFRTADGYIGLLPYTDRPWDQFFAVAGRSGTIANDPRDAAGLPRRQFARGEGVGCAAGGGAGGG